MESRTGLSCDFYPRPLRGGRPQGQRSSHCGHQISIHALCEEGDRYSSAAGAWYCDFYPRPLRGGRPIVVMLSPGCFGFLSTPSARRATANAVADAVAAIFLSTPSARRATGSPGCCAPAYFYFYPRPLRGGRPHSRRSSPVHSYFYPRPLRGGRPADLPDGEYTKEISIHALCEEGDLCRTQ